MARGPISTAARKIVSESFDQKPPDEQVEGQLRALAARFLADRIPGQLVLNLQEALMAASAFLAVENSAEWRRFWRIAEHAIPGLRSPPPPPSTAASTRAAAPSPTPP